MCTEGPKRSESAEKALIGSQLSTATLQKAIAALHQDSLNQTLSTVDRDRTEITVQICPATADRVRAPYVTKLNFAKY